MKKDEVTDDWQYALMPVRVRWNNDAHGISPVMEPSAEAQPRAGIWEDRMFISPAELRYLIPVKRWPTRKQIEELDAST